jgi:ribonuclease D
LLQVGAPGRVGLVDPLCVADLSPLWRLLADPDRTVVLHDAEQDIAFLSRQHGVTLGRVFDTAYAARLLGMRQLGLAGVVLELFGIQLSKKEQRSDWARRPLSPGQLGYAALDVVHLGNIKGVLEARLAAMNRLHMALQGFERIRTRVIVEKPPDPEGWRNLKGARALGPPERGVLRAVYLWREALAAARDCAPFRVLMPDSLVEVARTSPMTSQALAKVRGLPPWLSRGREALSLLAAIAEAGPLTEPLFPARPAETEADRQEMARFEALRLWRAKAATQMGVEVGVVISNAQLRTLARAAPASRDRSPPPAAACSRSWPASG